MKKIDKPSCQYLEPLQKVARKLIVTSVVSKPKMLNKKLPIIIFVPFIDAFGGVERLILALSRFLHARNRSHTIVCFGHKIDLFAHASWPIEMETLGFIASPLHNAKTLGKYLQRASANGSPPALLFDLKSAFYVGLLPRVRVPWCLHLTDPPSLLPSDASKFAPSARKVWPPFAALEASNRQFSMRAEILHRLNRRGARNAKNVIVMTQSIRDELAALYGVVPQIVRPGIQSWGDADLSAASTCASTCRSENREVRRLLSVSRLESNKRIDWILQALANYETQAAKAAWVLDVVGIGSQEKDLKFLTQRLGLDERVIFHGAVSDERLREIYRDADVFLMPAVQGYGLPALESLSAGLRVILHRESGVAEILQNNPRVEIIDEGITSLKYAIERVLQPLPDQISFDQLSHVPTDEEWAAEICRVCGWLKEETLAG